ncbi:MAG: hypothetical protein JW757_12935 [Anaerolineales bacterium]|nr:hypothetical protein [Anaerolineales bacterium]
MRITRDLLHRIAEDTVKERAHMDDTIIAAYLHGTVKEGDDPVLGGAADIDIVFIHENYDREREIIRMTEDVHLDIEHHSKALYQPPKELRTRPWLGYAIYNCHLLYDPQHFLDFTQAGVRGLFLHYENVLARAETLMNRSRATWLHFHNREAAFGPEQVRMYLQAVEDAVNAVACLYGPPFGGRRFLRQFKQLVEAQGVPELYKPVIQLVCGDLFPDGAAAVEEAKGWMLEWSDDFYRLNENYSVPAQLNYHRLAYYMRGYEAMLGSDEPETALWPLLDTWTLMAETMPSQSGTWQAVCERIGLTGKGFDGQLADLDALLDQIELLLEAWEPPEVGLG